FGAPAYSQEGGGVAITDIRQENTEKSTRIVIECSGALAYTYYSPDPLTLVVDIPETGAGSIPSRISVGTREVESLRVTQMARADGRSGAGVEARLASRAPSQVFSKDHSLPLVLERPGAAGKSEPAAKAAAAEPKAPEPVPAAEVKTDDTKSQPTAPTQAA